MDIDQERRAFAADLQQPQRRFSDEDCALWDAPLAAVMAHVPAGHQQHDPDLSMVPEELLREAIRVGKLLLAE